MTLRHLRSSTTDKRPQASGMAEGQLAINTASGSPGLFFKDSAGNLVKVGPVHVGSGAPNASPASGGTAGNSLGEQWLDTSGGTYVFKVWDGAAWRSEAGEFVNTTGDTMTGALGIIAGSASTPGLFFSGDANSGLYSPGADQVAISTGGSGRLFVDASGNVEITRNNNASVDSLTLSNLGTSSSTLSAFHQFKVFNGSSVDVAGAVAALGSTWSYGNAQPNSIILQGRQSGGVGIRSGNAPIIFSTGNSDAFFSTERLRITSAGLVGVGTSSPSYRIDVNNTGGGTGGIRLLSADQSTTRIRLENTGSGGRAYEIIGGLAGTDNSTFTVYDATAAATRLAIDSSGRVGIGTSAPSSKLSVAYGDAGLNGMNIEANINGTGEGLRINANTRTSADDATALLRVIDRTNTDALRVNVNGRVGIGTTSAGGILHTLTTGSDNVNFFERASGAKFGIYNSSVNSYIGTFSNHDLRLATNDTERARIDTSGRLLVGTSSVIDPFNSRLTLAGTGAGMTFNIAGFENYSNGPVLYFSDSRSSTVGTNTIVQNGDNLGRILFYGADGTGYTNGGGITCTVDGTPGVGDMPTRLVFSTTADGASSPTERLQIKADGAFRYTGNGSISTTTGYSSAGVAMEAGGALLATRSSASPVWINRLTNDGSLIDFGQDTIAEGSISVSGTTVSYNGAHLSRWSQLSGIDPYDKTVRPEILRGTVMSNLDEMCDWTCPTSGDCQDNEQLNKTKISDVEGDKNVAGVFQGWDDDDDTWVNDFYLAMTGDFVIRIAAGTTVERGDLLMSAGDGTAKPQDDDIIRSKTIAKVTSTNVSCTYDDGSYCVPCVLMAC